MKNSIGSLAALAAFTAAPALLEATPLPDPQAADFSNVALPYETAGSVYFDIDGDNTDDFRVYSNGYSVSILSTGSTLVSAAPVMFGDMFSPGDATMPSEYLNQVGAITFNSGYYGFSFATGGETHAAWVYFDFTGATKLAVHGAWQTVAGEGISVGAGAIPEPSTVAAIAGASALLGAVVFRRRRVAAPTADSAPIA
jgi:hypothetical protein